MLQMSEILTHTPVAHVTCPTCEAKTMVIVIAHVWLCPSTALIHMHPPQWDCPACLQETEIQKIWVEEAIHTSRHLPKALYRDLHTLCRFHSWVYRRVCDEWINRLCVYFKWRHIQILEVHTISHTLCKGGCKITLPWVPGYVGINGKEVVDAAARDASTQGWCHQLGF